MLDYIRLEIRRTLRDVGFVVFGIGMPVGMYLLFTNIGVDGREHASAAVFSMVGMASYGAVGAALGTGMGVAADRQVGWLRQLRVTPLSPMKLVVGRAVTGSVMVLPGITAVLLAGVVVNGVRLSPGQWAALAGLLWVGTLPFTLLGLGNGYRFSAQATGMVNVTCTMGLAVLGGLWFPVSLFPHWLAAIATWTPTNRFGQLGWSIAGGSLPSLGTAAVLAGWFAIFAGYAVSAYRRGTGSA
ncbi:ABC transporter permease [Streptomyces sp. RB6PN25]|uniref:ABC transporter permease n=1 Tax=Streptomyces humicola TaxID=2953240 RepID=A0ABT1PWT3_9ACTN|nr:ABC transporter permease [Streptomyces humicola]MCQ4082143.1 ABC transporter permease [Streptomyces humicola]